MTVRSMMPRQTWLLVHRYVGLVMAFFLLVSGLTGSLLAFYEELDTAVNAKVMTVVPPSPDARSLDPLVLREQIQARYPNTWVHWVNLALKPGHAWTFFLEGATDPDTGKHADVENDTLFVNPYTGEILGVRMWGDITQGLTNLMPFVYRLHYALALGTVGEYIFGIVALLWTLDCFVGAYLTFPAPTRRQNGRPNSQSPGDSQNSQRNWWVRWWPSWAMRWKGGRYKVNFDLHRAGGLWPWAMLFVLAWTGVGFNLSEVYKPVMGVVFTHQTRLEQVPKLVKAQPEPGIPWVEALKMGEELMASEARSKGFTILTAQRLSYDPEWGTYRYSVNSDRDLADWGGTSVWFDANTGEQRAVYLPTGEANGDTVGNWLFALHMAAVGGLAFQIFISVLGIAVAMLSVTGVVIWWKKRTSREQQKLRQTEPSSIIHSSKPADVPVEWDSDPAAKHSTL